MREEGGLSGRTFGDRCARDRVLGKLLSLVLHNGDNFDTIKHRLEWRALLGQCLALDLPLAIVRRVEPPGRPRRIGDGREF